MNKVIAVLALAVLILTAASQADADGRHTSARLESVGGSSVTGDVQLILLPHNGLNIQVVAEGLDPGQTYTSFYYDSPNCGGGAEEVDTFTANGGGVGSTQLHERHGEEEEEAFQSKLGIDIGM